MKYLPIDPILIIHSNFKCKYLKLNNSQLNELRIEQFLIQYFQIVYFKIKRVQNCTIILHWECSMLMLILLKMKGGGGGWV